MPCPSPHGAVTRSRGIDSSRRSVVALLIALQALTIIMGHVSTMPMTGAQSRTSRITSETRHHQLSALQDAKCVERYTALARAR